jgi:hypothetical protein
MRTIVATLACSQSQNNHFHSTRKSFYGINLWPFRIIICISFNIHFNIIFTIMTTASVERGMYASVGLVFTHTHTLISLLDNR